MDYKELYDQRNKPVKTTIDVLTRNVDKQTWSMFQGYCRFEGITATDKLKSLIAQYVKDQGKDKV